MPLMSLRMADKGITPTVLSSSHRTNINCLSFTFGGMVVTLFQWLVPSVCYEQRAAECQHTRPTGWTGSDQLRTRQKSITWLLACIILRIYICYIAMYMWDMRYHMTQAVGRAHDSVCVWLVYEIIVLLTAAWLFPQIGTMKSSYNERFSFPDPLSQNSASHATRHRIKKRIRAAMEEVPALQQQTGQVMTLTVAVTLSWSLKKTSVITMICWNYPILNQMFLTLQVIHSH